MLAYDDRNISGESIKFLLERDVEETAEVYAAYLIEKKEKKTIISDYLHLFPIKILFFILKKERVLGRLETQFSGPIEWSLTR